MENKEKIIKRIEYIDLLRILAVLAVIMIHVPDQNWYIVNVNRYEWRVFNVYNSFCRWSVPVFIMISGAVFLSKEYDIKTLYCKKIFRMITAFIFWSFLYAIMFCEGKNKLTIFSDFLKGEYHMWFIPMIIGIYMLYPVLKKIVDSEKLTKYFLVISFIVAFLLPQTADLLALTDNQYTYAISKAITSNLKNLKLFSGYIGYFVLGYYLSKKDITSQKRYVIYMLGIIGVLSTIFLTDMASKHTGDANSVFCGFTTVNVLFEALSVFVLAKYNFKTNKVLKYLSKITFGVYLSHVLILDYLKIQLGVNAMLFDPIISVPLITLIIFMISILLSGIIYRIPILKKYII